MTNILFYISGHGYGHTTRCIEIIKNISMHLPKYFCHVKTNAPEWFFQLYLTQNYRYNYFFNDIGTIQHDWLTVDKSTTLAALEEFWQDWGFMLEHELEYIRKNNIQLIFGDIPPIAFKIAHEAGIPAIAHGNFSWDWIYAAYQQEIPAFAGIIATIQEAYQQADLLLQLPFHGDMSIFPKRIEVPLVGRAAQLPPAIVRQRLPFQLAPDQLLGILSFRPDDLACIQLANLENLRHVQFIAFGKNNSNIKNINWLPPQFMPFPELVRAADFVVSKLGYGIVSECLINQTPLLYTSRDDFREYEVLRQGLEQFGISQFIPLPEFLAGDWARYLENMQLQPRHWPPLATNGVEVVTAQIEKFLG